jgi:two-component system response regulator CssR
MKLLPNYRSWGRRAVSYLIYLAEDEPNLNQVLVSYMQKEGWAVRSFMSGAEAQAAIAGGEAKPQLWVLDIMLPGVDGYELLRDIKAADAELPVIFISARDAELDRVIGLEMGSEDYLAKPFSPRELVIRARRLLDRLYGAKSGPASDQAGVAIAPYRIYPEQRLVKLGESVIDLTSKELDLVLFFVRHFGQPFAREQILTHVWGADYFGSDRVVDDVIRRVRKKLPELRLETMYGYGYRLVKP